MSNTCTTRQLCRVPPTSISPNLSPSCPIRTSLRPFEHHPASSATSTFAINIPFPDEASPISLPTPEKRRLPCSSTDVAGILASRTRRSTSYSLLRACICRVPFGHFFFSLACLSKAFTQLREIKPFLPSRLAGTGSVACRSDAMMRFEVGWLAGWLAGMWACCPCTS